MTETLFLGFITISSGSLKREDLPQKQKKRLPSYPLPILRISRLGVDKRYKGLGIGKELLKAMFKLSLEQKEMFRCVGVVVDAKDEAVKFYKKLGFIEIDIDKGLSRHYPKQSSMFLSIKSVKDASS